MGDAPDSTAAAAAAAVLQPPAAAPGASSAATTVKEKKKSKTTNTGKVKAKKIKGLFSDVAEQLTEVCRVLEKLPSDQADGGKERKKKLKDQMKKTNKKLVKLSQSIPLCEEYHQSNMPISLIEQIDNGRSPYAWLQEFVNQARSEGEQARGECLALSSLRSTISTMLEGHATGAQLPTEPSPPTLLEGETGTSYSVATMAAQD